MYEHTDDQYIFVFQSSPDSQSYGAKTMSTAQRISNCKCSYFRPSDYFPYPNHSLELRWIRIAQQTAPILQCSDQFKPRTSIKRGLPRDESSAKFFARRSAGLKLGYSRTHVTAPSKRCKNTLDQSCPSS